jgi:hypothetical protein
VDEQGDGSRHRPQLPVHPALDRLPTDEIVREQVAPLRLAGEIAQDGVRFPDRDVAVDEREDRRVQLRRRWPVRASRRSCRKILALEWQAELGKVNDLLPFDELSLPST